MKTDELIGALASDVGSRTATPLRVLAPALAVGALVMVALFFELLGPRPDLAAAIRTPRFLAKLLFSAALAATALPVAMMLARPEARPPFPTLMVAPLFLVGAVLLELIFVPAEAWPARLVGQNASTCLESIPVLSLPALAALLIALRRGAPLRPGVAGAMAGLAAAGCGALLYALHCPDDSPLFVAAWYSTAIGLVAALGAVLGTRLLRW